MTNIEDLIKDLEADDEKTRAFAAEDIAGDGLIEGIGPMLARLEIEPSRYVREVIVNSLKMMSGPELVSGVISCLQSDDAFVRNAGIDILALQGETALEALRESLGDADKDIRKFTLDVLLQIGGSAASGLVATGMSDPDINNVITAVEYLGRLEDERWIDKVNDLFARSENVLLRCTCLETMAVIGDERSLEYIARRYPNYQAISFLEQYSFLKFVARQGKTTHLSLIISLMNEKGQVMHKEIINAIEGILKRNPDKYLPDDLVQVLSTYLESDIKDINKCELLLLMGGYRNEAIFPILLQYLDPERGLICKGAVESLGLYGKLEALPRLESLKNQAGDEELLEIIDKSIDRLKWMR